MGGVERCEAGKEEEGREASPGKLAITSGTPAPWIKVDIRWDYTVGKKASSKSAMQGLTSAG